MLTGRPERLFVLDFGRFRVREDGREIGIPGFAIVTGAGETVLVDGGFPARYAGDARAGMRDGLDDFGTVLACGPEHLVAAQLSRAGLGPVDLVVLTHTHVDHVGALEADLGAPVVIGAAERRLARPIVWPGAVAMDWPAREYVEVTGDRPLGPGLTVLASPGHTPGHLSLMVELPGTGAVLIAGDAVSRPAEFASGFAGADDPAEAARSAARLTALAAEAGAFVIWGHDPLQWDALRKAPLFYG
jgi:N-acyl homoserine lactone hydrolase